MVYLNLICSTTFRELILLYNIPFKIVWLYFYSFEQNNIKNSKQNYRGQYIIDCEF